MAEAPLTERLQRAVQTLFEPDDIEFAIEWLVRECSAALLYVDNPSQLERIRATALKRSGGSLSDLEKATRLGQKDWRDLLMAAGFGQDLQAHETWLEQVGG